jgi:molybdenum cofactor biosynthesis enzyme
MNIKSYKKFSISDAKEKIFSSWNSFVDISKRERIATNELIILLKKALKGENLTESEISYIKSQSSNIAKIVGIMAMGSISMFIPIALNKVLSKWNIDIMPKDNKHFLDNK